MIAKSEKATAIGMLKGGMSVNEVAGELDLPLSLVQEWYIAEDITIVDNIQATTTALQRMSANANANDVTKAEKIKAGLEDVAITIITQLQFVASTADDIQKAQTLKLCSESVSKLYLMFGPQQGPIDPLSQLSNTGLSRFQQLMKD